jgi:hypothetical protein
LDDHEKEALRHFLEAIRELPPELQPQEIEERVSRGMDGAIIVSLTVQGAEPNLSLALLIAQKAEQLYKQTGCRFQLAQRAVGDPTALFYIWSGGTWKPVP